MSALPERVDPEDEPEIEYFDYSDWGWCEHCLKTGPVVVRVKRERNCTEVISELCINCDQK